VRLIQPCTVTSACAGCRAAGARTIDSKRILTAAVGGAGRVADTKPVRAASVGGAGRADDPRSARVADVRCTGRCRDPNPLCAAVVRGTRRAYDPRSAREAVGRCAGRGGDPKPVCAAAVGGVALVGIRDSCGAHRKPVVSSGVDAVAIRLPCVSEACGRQSGLMQATVSILEGCRVAVQGRLPQPV